MVLLASPIHASQCMLGVVGAGIVKGLLQRLRGWLRRDWRRLLRLRDQFELRFGNGRQVFEAMDRQVDARIEQGSLNFFGEQTLTTGRADGTNRHVARSGNPDDFRWDPVVLQLLCDPL